MQKALKLYWFAIVISASTLLQGQQNAPLIRTNTRLVLLDVVVTDKSGHPIRSLSKDSFTVLENGVPQKIVSFEAPPGDAAGGNPHAIPARTVILLDELNIAYPDLAYARDQIVAFLDKDALARQPTALMAVGPRGLEVVQSFTEDRSLLKDSLARLHAVNMTPKGMRDSGFGQEYAEKALGALTQIARSAVGAPSNLNVIWVTSGFSGLLQVSNNADAMKAGLRNLSNFLIRSRMRLYTIDPSGVMEMAPIAGKATGKTDIRAAHDSTAAQYIGNHQGENMEADMQLGSLTSLLGGRSYFGRNDVETALSQAVLDGASSYALTYSPSNSNFDGQYRKIQVETSIEGSSARTRDGYYAVAEEPKPDRDVVDVRLSSAMTNPLAYAGLDVTCPATYDGAKDHLTAKLIVTPRTQSGATDQTEEIIRLASFSRDRKLLDNWSWRVNWKTPWTNRVISATFDRALSPKANSIRFLVSDPAAQFIGTCDYRLH